MPLTMRPAKKKDVNDLCALMEGLNHRPISPNDMLNRLQMVAESKIDSLYVCEDSGKIAGLLGFRIRENLEELSWFGEISAIVVYPNVKRKGVGRFMMDYAEKLAREKHCKGMWLVSGFPRKDEAHLFYTRLGFQTTGYRFVKLFPKT